MFFARFCSHFYLKLCRTQIIFGYYKKKFLHIQIHTSQGSTGGSLDSVYLDPLAVTLCGDRVVIAALRLKLVVWVNCNPLEQMPL